MGVVPSQERFRTKGLDQRCGYLLLRYIKLVGKTDVNAWQNLVDDAYQVIADGFPLDCHVSPDQRPPLCFGKDLCPDGQERNCLHTLWYGPFWWVRTMGQGPGYHSPMMVPQTTDNYELLAFQLHHGVWLGKEYVSQALAVLAQDQEAERLNKRSGLPHYIPDGDVMNQWSSIVQMVEKTNLERIRLHLSRGLVAMDLITVYRAWDDLLDAANAENWNMGNRIYPLVVKQQRMTDLRERETRLCDELSVNSGISLSKFVEELRTYMIRMKDVNKANEQYGMTGRPEAQGGYHKMMSMLHILDKIHKMLQKHLQEALRRGT